MYRKISEKLEQWLVNPNRKPLIIRGARQVGKTWVVRNFAKSCSRQLIELNFERNSKIYDSFLVSNNPREILKDLELSLNISIDISNSLLFIDEIQVKPECLAKLRWFAEELPELPVISAGSLLEFVLESPTFSMPVGRINYLFLEPMSFEEFLIAGGNKNLYQFLNDYKINLNVPISENIHEKLLILFQEYILIGGMPAVCQEYFTRSSSEEIDIIQNNLITTYRDDFHKYNKKIVTERLDEVMYSVPLMLGNKYTYSKVNPNIKGQEIKSSLHLLSQARLCHYVYANYAHGIPLGAQVNSKFFKMIFLDTGLATAMLGLNKAMNILNISRLDLINKGAISEQVIGQLLRVISPMHIEPSLYYWQREQAGSAAEIDYIIQYQDCVVPIEVKSGSTGSLKSLHVFMAEKALKQALRINSDKLSVTTVSVNTPVKQHVKYNLLSIPFYFTEQLPRLLEQCQSISQ